MERKWREKGSGRERVRERGKKGGEGFAFFIARKEINQKILNKASLSLKLFTSKNILFGS